VLGILAQAILAVFVAPAQAIIQPYLHNQLAQYLSNNNTYMIVSVVSKLHN